MKILLKLAFLGFFLLSSTLSFSADRGTQSEAIALVKKAGDYLKKNGKEKAFAEFNNSKGQFVDRDLYIFAFLANGDGIERANGANIKLVGKNLLEMKDADGKFLIKEILATGTNNDGKGWVDYKWPNPVSGGIENKRTYIEKFDDVLIGCGVYK
ncbi:cache domain-containing protein [Undibacterium jejuense]|uniref:Cache domain-containing protein n=1 Tax=Undibacterium jejuense TaxID=1344949 RepID=A0A923KRT9_9BURK|nr:cache domain-containing protein [Undibacterium jejuense]MBC3864329.1 cache domain-containing protein [Undibacterium jejuense]